MFGDRRPHACGDDPEIEILSVKPEKPYKVTFIEWRATQAPPPPTGRRAFIFQALGNPKPSHWRMAGRSL